MPEEIPQVQVTTSNKTSWKKISLTVLIIIVVSGLIVGAYWFFVLNKDSDTSDLTGPVPKPNVPVTTESATPSSTTSNAKDETSGWNTYEYNYQDLIKYSIKYPNSWEAVRPAHNGPYSSISKEEAFISIDTPGATTKGFFEQQKNSARNFNWIEPPTEKNIKFSGQEAWQISGVTEDIFLEPGKKKYLLKILLTSPSGYYMSISYSDNTSKTNSKTVDKILSTFKFLD